VPTFQPSAAAFTPKPVAAPTAKPVSVNVATYDPAAPPAQVSRAPVRSPQPPAQKYHDLNNPQKEGVLRLPTVNFPKPKVSIFFAFCDKGAILRFRTRSLLLLETSRHS